MRLAYCGVHNALQAKKENASATLSIKEWVAFAESEVRKCSEIPESRLLMGRIFFELKQWKEAEPWYRTLLGEPPSMSPAAFRDYYFILEQLGNHSALEALEKYRHQNPPKDKF